MGSRHNSFAETAWSTNRSRRRSSFTLGTVSGTVVVGTQRADVNNTDRMDPQDQQIEIPVVTKRFGTQFDLAVDGSTSHPVPIDVAPLTTEFETIMQQCRDRTGV
jgi:hypothetical protein